MNLTENLVNLLNQSHFYKEFSFAKNKFFPESSSEQEFADYVVWLRDILIVYQIKERIGGGSPSTKNERTWFKKKVLGLAKKQIKDSLGFLHRCPNIKIVNQRGDAFDIKTPDIRRIFCVVIYRTPNFLPRNCLIQKLVVSRSAGPIHVFSWDDYRLVLEALITPGEFIEYLEYRQQLLTQFEDLKRKTERNILGRYLWLPPLEAVTKHCINKDFSEYVEQLISDVGRFDISYILNNLGDKIEESESELGKKTDYYYILVELAKLGRLELVAAKRRITKCLEAVDSSSLQLPYRFISTSSRCGFLFVPIQSGRISEEVNLLVNLTVLSKYEQKLQRHVGISFAKRPSNIVYIRWVLVDNPWNYDSRIDKLLKEECPFRPLRTCIGFPYRFQRNQENK